MEGPQNKSKSTEIRLLARELVDDMELGRISVEQTVFKALRLARLADAEEEQAWLRYELIGYLDNSEISTRYMGWAGRWTNQASQLGYRYPLAQIEAMLVQARLQAQTVRIPDVNASVSLSSANPNEYVGGSYFDKRALPDPTKAITTVTDYANGLKNEVTQYSGIRAKTLAMIYNFAVNQYHKREFSSITENIFDQYRIQVDSLLLDISVEVLQKIPSIWMRLGEGEAEAVSAAVSTCRRIIDTFAESVSPESDLTNDVIRNEKLTRGYTTRYRLRNYIAVSTESKSQKERLNRSLADIYNKVSTGVHKDVDFAEARSLFLGTYLLLGEILTLPNRPPISRPTGAYPAGAILPSPNEVPDGSTDTALENP